jgi:iron complex outermembrane receptor protein
MTFKGALAGTASAIALLTAFTPVQAQQQGSSSAGAQSGPIEEVVVTGIRASRERALDIKKNSTAIIDVVSATDIGKLPDKNVADALQRVPGVNTQSAASGEGGFDENDRVSIRGTSPSLANVTVDGHNVSTGDWFILDQFSTVGRSISFDLLPAEIVDSAVVHKSQSADMIEGGVAGSVDMITHKPLDLVFTQQFTFEGSAQYEYADLPGKFDPQLNGMMVWHNNSDTFGILAQGFFEKRDLEREGQEFLGYNTITKAAEPALVAADPNLNGVLYPTLIGAALFQQQRQREGGDLTMQWRPNNEFDFVLSSFYSNMDAGDTNNNFMVWDQNEISNQNLPTSYTVKNGTLVQAVFPKINDDPGAPGFGNVVDGVVEDSIDRPHESSSTWYVDGDAKWTPTQDWNVHFKLGYTRGEGLTPSQPTWESDGATGTSFNFANGGPAAVSFPDINTADPADMNNDWAWSDKFTARDTEFYTQADAEYEFNAGILQSVKFGARYSDHIRNVSGYDQGTCTFACPATPSSLISNGGMYPSNFGSALGGGPGFLQDIWAPNWSEVQQQVLGALVANNVAAGLPAGTQYSPLAFYWPGSFRVQEKDWAAYAMANFAGDKWNANAGLRFVHTGEDVTTYVSDVSGTANNYGAYAVVPVNHTYTDPLPSATFNYNLTDDQILRASVANVMARPDYSALGGAVSLTDSILTGTGGNPNLKPVRAWTYDADWEWYFGDASLLSASIFYMDLTTDVDYGVNYATYLNATLTGQQHMPVYSTYAITSPQNSSGTDKGIELSWEQPIWNGFGIQTNYTYSDGKQAGGGPLIGDSKNLYNIVGYYEKYGFSARLAWTWRSAVLVGLDRSTAENEAAIGNLAASASYDITDNVSLTFDALNLNNAILKYYANNTSQPRAFYDNGRQFYLGFRVKF